MKTNDQELILDYLHGRESVDAAQLNELLRHDAEARTFLRLASATEVRLCELALTDRSTVAVAPRTAAVRWMRAISQMAAGVVLGGLAVSAVWAYALPRLPTSRVLPLVNGGFESAEAMANSVRQQVGHWAADPCAVVEQQGGVSAREGQHMLQFLAASNTGDYEGSKNMASDMWQVVELPGSGHRTVKVRAWFNAETSKQARFHIAAVAGDGDVANAPRLWEQRYSEGGSLAFARSMTFVDHDPATWEAGELTLQVPPQARVLVIGIAAYRLPVIPANEWFPAQFVDDVSVSITEEAGL
jgi:hypothetical protein